MNALKAFNLNQWIDQHREFLKPPVCNRRVFQHSEFIIMVVGGPNSRSDYHEDPGEEFFYQLEGTMTLRTMQDRGRVDIPIHEGEVLLLPPRVPHSPQRLRQHCRAGRSSASAGPRSRTASSGTASTASTRSMPSTCTSSDIEKQLPPIFERFYGSPQNRTCQACGTVAHKR